ncbi:MAG: hypothetical protein ACT4PT_02060 [Methanobacteriota archaeon]
MKAHGFVAIAAVALSVSVLAWSAADSPGHEGGHAAPAATGPFVLSLEDCREGGGVSMYNVREGDTFPIEPFGARDVSDELGDPKVGSYFRPLTEDVTGIWHISLVCERYSVAGSGKQGAGPSADAGSRPTANGPLKWGWVGIAILAPPWDDSGIERQYLVADLSFSDWDLVERVQAATGTHASRMLDGAVEWLAPGVFHQLMDDEDHGIFQTHSLLREYRDLPARTTRFWMLVSEDDRHLHGGDELGGEIGAEGRFRPVSFDLVDTEGAGHFVSYDGTAVLSHTRTEAHGARPGAAGNLAAVLYDGFARTMVPGPAPDLVLEKTWLH